MADKPLHFDSQLIHGGQQFDPSTGAVMTPIYATSTYVQSAPGEHSGYEYSRSGNPTRTALENSLKMLGCGGAAFAFSSGMAAISTIIDLLDSGSHIVANEDLYGGTSRLFNQVRKQTAQLQTTYVTMSNLEDVAAAITPETKMLWTETPSNPMMQIADLSALSALAKQHNLLFVVDNTFATPWIQQPLEFGADIVVHSTTKYLNGHSDVVGGAVIVSKSRPEISERLQFLQNAIGAVPGPFDCFLTLRGIKTLALRMQRHCDNAIQLARWLEEQPQVTQVFYPGLPSHPQHEIAKQQMRAFGGMISFELSGGLEAAKRCLANMKVFALAESLGGVESLAEHPAIMTHAAVPAARRAELGISDGLIRLSVGIEHFSDLQTDLTFK